MYRTRIQRNESGFTLIELLVVIGIIGLLIGLLAPALHRAQICAGSLSDSNSQSQIHKAFLIFANSNKSRLPLPGLINRLPDPNLGDTPGVGLEDKSLNHTAALYSSMVAGEFFNTDILIGPTEINENVVEMEDYNYSAYSPGDDVYWDDEFAANIHIPPGAGFECNTSYAHMALVGERKIRKWKDSQRSGDPALGTRGTGHTDSERGGAASGEEYDLSPTLLLHGAKKQWVGNICFMDNHVAGNLDNFYPQVTSYEPANGTQEAKDNIFDAEFEDHVEHRHASADAFLVICTSADPSGFWVANHYDALID